MKNVPELFGSLVFNDKAMQERLPSTVYKTLKKTIQRGAPLDPGISDIVASAMRDWAISKGATHFTHWFQPMTGITAEKHDSFITPTKDGGVIMEFSGKELIKGEPDASSFPSGGIRATFEARGYTAWDPTSYAFIKDGVLCIPTAFCAYGGEALDEKTPLLRSMDALNTQALRILRLFGNNEAQRVISTVGAEQEYFLINKDLFEKRKDLVYTGRTLWGAKPPKGQELEDHYFGAIKTRIVNYMAELDEQLWKMGVPSKTKHNEVAPSQHELAVVYGTTNLSTDQNQLVMETMKKVAINHGLINLLHEKPFAGINGSGKHNNWSIATEKANLLDPGASPAENAQFLLFLAAIVKAVDDYQDLLRISVASAGNDHRLGADEAPPAIISMFLGTELSDVVDSIVDKKPLNQLEKKALEIGVSVLPQFPKDNTDRNRTSPFAFTGNKFEFRMPGSSQSIAKCNYILNTIVAESLALFADELEKAKDFNTALQKLIAKTLKEHRRIIFNGNNYSDEWKKEAAKRGLLNLRSTVDALPYFINEKNLKLFIKHKILTEIEMHSRYEIMVEAYCKILKIEALAMIDMAKKDILPASEKYQKEIAKTAAMKLNAGVDAVELEKKLLTKLSALTLAFYNKTEELENKLLEIKNCHDLLAEAKFFREQVFVTMQELRSIGDELETLVGAEHWPFPAYAEILFSV
ncbi:MAG: glutamine synthetase III [Clostridiaceae bacterium]|jgi:glutamine synthetase|nr:glutamine synthetase III [Clostridiaceae bacterium]